LVSGFWFLVSGFWFLVSGCWLLVSGCWLLVSGFWLLVSGCWLLVSGFWLLVAGVRGPAAAVRIRRVALPATMSAMIARALAFLLLLAATVVADDLDELLDGVHEVGVAGVPGPLCVVGRDAFPVVAGSVGKFRAPLVAAARWGEGRVVAFGHGGYLHRGTMTQGDTRALVLNAVRWVGGERVATVRLPDLPGTPLADAQWWTQLDGFDVLCVDTHLIRSDAARAAVAAFVKGGGGLVTAGLGWGWSQLNPGKDLPTEHPGNRLLGAAGIYWADGTLRAPTVDRAALAGTHAGRALDGKLDAQAGWVLTQAARALPPDDTLLRPKLDALAAAPVSKFPVKSGRARLALTMQLLAREHDVEAHPAAAHFPGAVEAEPVARTLSIDTGVPGWHSTGLYAAPGAAVSIDVPAAAAGQDLWLRIGAHNDRLWNKPAWRRAPEICRRVPIAKTATATPSAFGGPVYVEVPRGCGLGPIDVKIRGAVPAPYYVHGVTTPEEWKRVRAYPGPWAELQGKNVILTVPSRLVRTLDHPAALMDFWDSVLDQCADLAARPRERERPERLVADIQISVGYMHAGYPIMTHLDAAERMVDLAHMKRGDWGMFHELGHNHQHRDWTFAGTVEVTCNLFTLYVFEKLCGAPAATHKSLAPEKRAQTVAQYVAGGRDFDHWKAKPFLALVMYVQLREEFGWETFRKAFAEYRALPKAERPKNDAEKRDQWLVRFSRATGKNLGPFFRAWGVPTSDAARAEVADLPAWMPEGLPAAD
jgi:hypothetical protein